MLGELDMALSGKQTSISHKRYKIRP